MRFMAEVSFWRPLKSVVSCNLFIIIILIIIIVIIIIFFGRIFSECTEANATSLIPLDTIHPEKWFSCTVWGPWLAL